MTIQMRERLRSLKWVVAAIVFLLAISITWADVYGTPTGEVGNNSQVNRIDNSNAGNSSASTTHSTKCGDNPPSSIPEPTTLILLGGGLSAMYVMRKRRQTKHQVR
jgi:hypothetical protein